MSLNKDDSSKLNYKAKIDWYKERIASLSQDFSNPSVSKEDINPDQYIANLRDLRKKADKLSKRIDDSCSGLRIPVDKNKDPDVYTALLIVDPKSGGEYVSYELYKKLSEQVMSGMTSLKLDDILTNCSSDVNSNSKFIQDRIYAGYSSYSGKKQTYHNGYEGNIFNWEDWDYNVRHILGFSDEYLGTYPTISYEPWGFKADVMLEQTQTDGLIGLWNGYSEAGKKDIEQFGGAFKNLTALKPDPNIAGITDRYLDHANKFLNDLEKLLGTRWTGDLICCFLKYVVNLDSKTIEGWLTNLQFLKEVINFDFGEATSALGDLFRNYLRYVIMDQLMAYIHQIFCRLMDPLRKWVRELGEKGDKIFECTPIKMLILQYADAAIQYTDNYIREMIAEWYREHELKRIYQEMRISQAHEAKWLNQAISLLSMVVNAIEMSAQCGLENSPNNDAANKLMDQLTGSSVYVYPIEENPNIYNSFITLEQQRAIEGFKATGDNTAVVNIMNQNRIQEEAAVSRGMDDCRRNITTENLPAPISWSI